MFKEMEEKLQQDPDTFAEPFKAMLKSYGRLKTKNNFVSAIRMFGRYSGINLARRKVKPKVAGMQVSGPSIGVQPTAIGRRRVKLGGRRRLTGGRPTKQEAVVEHGYARASSSSQLPCKKRVAAPHSLSHAVTVCQSIGKTHNAK
ncbi:uncharacterized protein LOC115923335 [Strongylocentrotus purpuratus]|uniref:Uncharacterized protein n=1 Tax=Strongylocentrotus purpuratus TaxID=7668 RepID=A0A7M7SY07_STRPU|nr:uncharacterized protein LOC115923335 [Strongylocentrotus purpuratus]